MTGAISELRKIASVHDGARHGPITRLIDPAGLGEDLKPFIFLDFFNAPIIPGFGFPMHPHSGIATLTWQPGSDVRYKDTTGKDGILRAGGLEWMNAGGGAWHQGTLLASGMTTGVQLWVPMPPAVEDGEPFGQYVSPEEVPRLTLPCGEMLVLLGNHSEGGRRANSPIDAHQDMAYLALKLVPGRAYRFNPPPAHSIAWIFPFDGTVRMQGQVLGRRLAVLSEEGAVEVEAIGGKATALIGTGRPHQHPLILGTSSVHTNQRSLERALQRIEHVRPR